MIRAIAIDDEPLALEVVRAHAEKVPFLQLQETFTNAFKALDYLAKNPVDLLFLDIKMPDISGLDLFASLSLKPNVIFTTAYPEHAVQSYELDAVDYLLKPFSFTRFLKACHKVNDIIYPKNLNRQPDSGMLVKSGYHKIKVKFDEILFLESAGNYMTFALADGRRFLSRMTMTEVMAMLPGDDFIRVHRSYIVNKTKVDKAERHQLRVAGHQIPVSFKVSFD